MWIEVEREDDVEFVNPTWDWDWPAEAHYTHRPYDLA